MMKKKTMLSSGSLKGGVLAVCGMMSFAYDGLADEAPLSVASSIRPIDIIVRQIGGEAIDAHLILSADQSAHHTDLRPSQRQVIEDSAIIFAIDPLMEGGLAKLMAQSPEKWVLLSQDLASELRTRAQVEDEHHDEHHDGHEDEHHDDHHDGHKDEHHDEHHDEHEDEHHDDTHEEHDGHAHGVGVDYHLFFAPHLSADIAAIVTARLSALRPEKADMFAANYEALVQMTEAAEAAMAETLASTAPNYFVGMHDITLYLEADLPLAPAGHLLVHGHGKPSAGHLRDLQQAVADNGASCVFYEPQISKRLVSQLSADMNLPVVILDPMGSGLANDATVGDYWQSVAASLKRCFAQ